MKLVILALCIWSSQAKKDAACKNYPVIRNGDVHVQPGETELTVQCALLYTLKGPERVLCVDGKWSRLPVCLSPCKLDQRLFYFPQNEYISHGEAVRFRCSMNGWIDVKCNNGKTLYKGCGYYDW